MISQQWFCLEYVQTGPCDTSLSKCFGQSLGIYQSAACCIDQYSIVSHPAQPGSIDEVPCLGRKGKMKGENPSFLKKLLQLKLLHSQRGELLRWNQRIISSELKAESSRPFEHCPGDTAKASGGKYGIPESGKGGGWGDFPGPLPDEGIGLRKSPGQGEGECERMVRDLINAVVGNIANRDVSCSGRLEINVVDPDAVANDDPALIEVGDDFAGDWRPLNQQSVGFPTLCYDILRGFALRDMKLCSGLRDDFTLAVDMGESVIGDEDVH
nr:hypothetical protein [Terrimicrobium sacchariphilum]